MMVATPSAIAMGGDWQQDIGNGWRICGANGTDCIVSPGGSGLACVWEKRFETGCSIFRRYAWVGDILLVEAGPNSLFDEARRDVRRYFVLRDPEASEERPIDRDAFERVLQEIGMIDEPDWIATRSLWRIREKAANWTLIGLAALMGAGMLVAKWRRSLAKPVGALAVKQ